MNRNISRFVVAAALTILAIFSFAPNASAKITNWAGDAEQMVKLCNASGGTGKYDPRTGTGTCFGKEGGITICDKPTAENPYNCTTSDTSPR